MAPCEADPFVPPVPDAEEREAGDEVERPRADRRGAPCLNEGRAPGGRGDGKSPPGPLKYDVCAPRDMGSIPERGGEGQGPDWCTSPPCAPRPLPVQQLPPPRSRASGAPLFSCHCAGGDHPAEWRRFLFGLKRAKCCGISPLSFCRLSLRLEKGEPLLRFPQCLICIFQLHNIKYVRSMFVFRLIRLFSFDSCLPGSLLL